MTLNPAQRESVEARDADILCLACAGAGKTRVLIESADGQDEWDTVGVSENIIIASYEALVDSIEYKLFLSRGGGKAGLS